MVHLCNRTIKNILHSFIPHETITYDHRDPSWIDSAIRRLIQDKNEAYKRFKRGNSNSQHFENVQSLQNLLKVSIEASKQRYYSRLSKKLMEPSTSPKTYWSVPWPTKIHGHICHILKDKTKRPVFRKLSVINLWFSLHSIDRISKEKKIIEVLRIKNLKYDRNFQLTNCFFNWYSSFRSY